MPHAPGSLLCELCHVYVTVVTRSAAPVCGEFWVRQRRVTLQAAAWRLPLILTEADHPATDISGFAGGRPATQRRMNAISVVVVPEVQQLPFEIPGAPKKGLDPEALAALCRPIVQ